MITYIILALFGAFVYYSLKPSRKPFEMTEEWWIRNNPDQPYPLDK